MNTNLFMILDGIDSRDFGIYVVDPIPPILSPAMRVISTVTIPGRSGSVTFSDGAFDEYEKTVQLYFDGIEAQAAIDYLADPSFATFSNEPDKMYPCRRSGATAFDRLRRQRFKFPYTLTVNPLKRLRDPDSYDIGSGIVLRNNTNEPAYPSFDVLGTGDLTVTVGLQTFSIAGVSGSLTVEGGEVFSAFDENGSANSRMTGEFPCLDVGEEYEISFAGVSFVTIWPNWRWH